METWPDLRLDPLPAAEDVMASIDTLMRSGAARFGDAPAVIRRDETFSYKTLDRAVDSCAAALAQVLPSPVSGARIGLNVQKQPGNILLLLAVLRLGAIAVPLNPALTPVQLAYIADNCAMSAAFVPAKTLSAMPSGSSTLWLDNAAPLGGIAAPDDIASWAENSANPLQCPSVPDDTALLFYTSGSTGQPKGVMVSHRAVVLGALSVAHYLRLSSDDRVLSVLPLSFDYGFNQLTATWAAGAAVVLHDYFLPADVPKVIAKQGVTGLAGVPPLWHQLLDVNWPQGAAGSLRYVTNSGGRLTPALQQRLRSLLPDTDIIAMYGLTEAFRSTYMPPDDLAAKPTAMGRAIPYAYVGVVRGDGSLAEDGETGELVHAGPLVGQGYWNDPERTQRRFRPVPKGMLAKVPAVYHDRCVFSGDQVMRDTDGDLHFIGRADEMIKVLGNRLSPEEVEAAAVQVGGVGAAAAFGLEDETIGARIALVFEHSGDADALKAEVRVKCRELLPGYAQPHYVLPRGGLPRNANGKLDRPALRKWVTTQVQAESASA